MNVEEEGVGEGGQEDEAASPGQEMFDGVADGLVQVTQHVPQLTYTEKSLWQNFSLKTFQRSFQFSVNSASIWTP